MGVSLPPQGAPASPDATLMATIVLQRYWKVAVAFAVLQAVTANEEERTCSNADSINDDDPTTESSSCSAAANTGAAPPWSEAARTDRYLYDCDLDPLSLKKDLDRYPTIHQEDVDTAERVYGAHARRLVIKDNVLYARDCAPGAIVGVSEFVEGMLKLLLQRVTVPDVDFVLNCSDFPAVNKQKVESSNKKKLMPDVPVVSMCCSTLYNDIIVPTYTLALTVTGRSRPSNQAARLPWEQRKPQMVWRGSDSNRARFRFNLLANNNSNAAVSEKLDVGIHRMVRIPHDPAVHGPVKDAMPQREFGDYKWIANIDGSVAAYRMPDVIALGSTVVKQESHFLEHWYRHLLPWQHYVPMANDFSDLEAVLEWLSTHDEQAREIGEAGRQFALSNLQPEHVQCFWYVFLYEYAARMTYQPQVLDGMEAS